MADTLRAALASIAADHTGWPAHAIADETHFNDEMGFDTDDLFDLIADVERKHRIDISEADRSGIATFGDLLACVTRKIAPPKHEPEDPSILGAVF